MRRSNPACPPKLAERRRVLSSPQTQTGLLRFARNDVGNAMPSRGIVRYSIVKQPYTPAFALRASTWQARVIAPLPVRLGAAGRFFLFFHSSSPEGARGTTGRNPPLRRPHFCCGQPACRWPRHTGDGPAQRSKPVKLNRALEAGFACVPHATVLSACNSQRRHVLAP